MYFLTYMAANTFPWVPKSMEYGSNLLGCSSDIVCWYWYSEINNGTIGYLYQQSPLNLSTCIEYGNWNWNSCSSGPVWKRAWRPLFYSPRATAAEKPAKQMNPITHLSTMYMTKLVANALAVPNTAMMRYVAIINGFLPNLWKK